MTDAPGFVSTVEDFISIQFLIDAEVTVNYLLLKRQHLRSGNIKFE